MSKIESPTFAIALAVVRRHETTRLVATVVYQHQESGKLRSPVATGAYDPQFAFADLAITAYLSAKQDDGLHTIYGWNVAYEDLYQVDLQRADVMARTLRKVQRGLDKLNSERGYVGSFHEYVIRVASVLGIRTFYVEARGEGIGQLFSGLRYRPTDGSGVQAWTADRARDVLDGKIAV